MLDRHHTILIIDDSPSDRKIYRRFLNSQKIYEFEIREAGTVKAGLESCKELAPDCVILDYHLPDRDGDGLSALEEIQEASHAPIIFISGKPEALVVTEAYRRGAVRYISKDTVTSASIQEAVYDALQLPY